MIVIFIILLLGLGGVCGLCRSFVLRSLKAHGNDKD